MPTSDMPIKPRNPANAAVIAVVMLTTKGVKNNNPITSQLGLTSYA